MSEVSVSDVSIANLALTSLGADTIMSLDEDNEVARKVNAVYSLIRDEVLRAHPWNFAIRWAALARLSETPANDFSYAYQLPSAPYCLKVIKLNYDEEFDDFRIEGRKLYTDLESVTLEYIARITDATQFDSAFVTAFAARLAAELAYSITGDQNLAKQKWEEYFLKIRQAKALDSQEGKPEYIDQSKWINDRGDDINDDVFTTS